MKQLAKLYGDRKDLYKKYVSTHAIDYDDQESMVQLIRFMEAN